MAQPINQKEYLKKYLGIGKKVGDKKKRKKKEKSESTRLKIIDDDVDALISYEITEDLNGETEDAPQIVEIIDERPLSMQTDDKTNTKLWKPIGEADDNIVQDIRKKNRTTSKHFITSYSSQDSSQGENVNKKSEDDYSPPRKHSKRYHSDNDFSPPRRSSNKNHSNDISPPRKTSNRSSTHTNSNEDNSPPRKRAGSQHLNNDMSPPRKQSRDVSSAKRNNDYDNSPPRKKKSVSSRSKNSYNNDNSPPRKKQSCEDYPRKQKKDQREREDCTKRKKSRWNDEEPEASTSKKMDTTLDGKKAGLQNALDLAIETQMIKKKEEEMFKKMSAEVSGVNAATIVRGKRPVNPEEEARKKIKEKENKEKYNKWGRGLKQVEDHNEKVAQELYEMSKPLARYADDEDLEKYLKEQEREGDPMLAYIRKKKHKDAVESGKPTKPIYQGEFMPNRFAIRPGYRWDGVDRSNGYEKKWFNVQNARIADQEESYKWSTEDM